MAKLKDGQIVTDIKTLSQVAQTGIRYGWKARDGLCGSRHCCKCGRMDHHSAKIPKATKEKLGERIAKELMDALEKQAAQRRFLVGAGPLRFDANAIGYDAPEKPN